MAEPRNARKTYMMLSKENAELYVVNDEGHVIEEYPTTHTTINETKSKVESPPSSGVYKVTTTRTAVNNAAFTFRFPQEFINSTNPRWIEVHHVKALYNGNDMKDLILHSDIIRRDPYLDHSVMVVNEVRTKYKKYAYTLREPTFTIWFTSFKEPGIPIDPDNITFMVELMLIY